MSYSLTRSRTIQYIGILLALLLIAASYWYFAVRAGVKTNTTAGQPQGDGDLAAGLAGYWKLDENTGTSAADSSVNAITAGTLTNGPTWTTGQIGSSVDFDGTNDYITIPDNAAVDFGDTDDMTITGWFNRDTATTTDEIIAKWDGVGAGYRVFMSGTLDAIAFEINDGTDTYDLLGNTTFTSPGWHHFAVVWDQDSAANTEIYVDGRPDLAADGGTIGNIGSVANALALNIGAEAGGTANFFDGKIDEVRVYDRALSPSEITDLFRQTVPTGVDTSLRGYWAFGPDDIRGTLVSDRSGNRGTGTITGNPTKTIGRIGQALDYDGTGDFVDIGDVNAIDGLTAITTAIWMKTTASGERHFFDKSSCDGGTNSATFEMLTGGFTAEKASFVIFPADGTPSNYQNVTSSVSVTDGLWHHVVGTYDGTTLRIYVDGVQSGTVSFPGETLSSTSRPLQIGGDCDGNPAGYDWDGELDEARIYSRALSAAEIKSLYDQSAPDKANTSATQPAGVGNAASGLVGYWKLDENTGTSAADSSTNAIAAGTLTNGPTWTTGQIGSAVDFDGTNDYITVADNALLDFGDTESMTITGWFNRDTATTDDVIVAKADGNFLLGYDVMIDDATDVLVVTFSIDGSNYYAAGSTTTFTSTGWHHFAVTWTGSVARIYIDGVFDETTPSAAGTVGSLASTLTFNIGSESDGGNPFDGKLDEIRIYDRVLSTDEVVGLYRTTTPTGVDTALQGYWSFNAPDTPSTIAYDRSGARNTGTLTNGPTKAIGRVGQALDFDGTDDYIDVGSAAALDDLDPISICVWVKPDTIGNDPRIYAKADASGLSGVGINLTQTSNRFEFRHGWTNTTDTRWNTPNDSIVTGVWQHLCATYDGSSSTNDPALYIDGLANQVIEVVAPSGTLSSDASYTAIIGNRPDAARPFDGELDELRVYNRVLSTAEVKSLYDLGTPDKMNTSASTPQGTGRMDSGLAGYWKLDDGTSGATPTTAADSSTNSITAGTLTNGPVWTTGQIGSAVDFDGTDDYIAVADTPLLDFGDADDFTLTGWFSRDTATTDDVIVAKRTTLVAGSTGYVAYLDASTDQLIFEVSDGTDEYSLTSESTFTSGAKTGWHHFAIVWDQDSSGDSEIYIDGIPDRATDSGTIGNIGDLSNAFQLGIGVNSLANNPFDGKIDEVRVYSRALSAEEVANVYRLTSPTGTDTGLKGYWSFNGQDVNGTTVMDRSGAGNDGTLTNGATVTIGKLGQGLSLDGANDFVNAGSATNIDNLTNLSACAWINPDALPTGYTAIISQMDNGGAEATFGFHDDSANERIDFYRTFSTNPGEWRSDANVVPMGAWSHVCVTYNKSSAANNPLFYLNGAEIGVVETSTPAGTASSTAGGDYFIGALDDGGAGTEFFDGKLDEVRLYDRILTAAEIKSLYNSGR